MVNPVDNPTPCPTGYIPVHTQVDRATAEVRGLVTAACKCPHADKQPCHEHGCRRRRAIDAVKALGTKSPARFCRCIDPVHCGFHGCCSPERRLQNARPI